MTKVGLGISAKLGQTIKAFKEGFGVNGLFMSVLHQKTSYIHVYYKIKDSNDVHKIPLSFKTKKFNFTLLQYHMTKEGIRIRGDCKKHRFIHSKD